MEFRLKTHVRYGFGDLHNGIITGPSGQHGRDRISLHVHLSSGGPVRAGNRFVAPSSHPAVQVQVSKPAVPSLNLNTALSFVGTQLLKVSALGCFEIGGESSSSQRIPSGLYHMLRI